MNRKLYFNHIFALMIVVITVTIIHLELDTDIFQAGDLEANISETAYQACLDYGEEYGIAPEFLMAVIEVESGGQKTAKNGNCLGLMQISSRWNADRMAKIGVTNLYDERQNIHVGADILAEFFRKYEDPCLVLDKYNGNSKADYNFENGIVSKYADKVLKRSEQLERLHEENDAKG